MDELKNLRKQIDEVDSHLVQLLGKRIAIMKAIGNVKKQLKTDIKDVMREKEKIAQLEKKAFVYGIPNEVIIKIWDIFFTFAQHIER